jgi:hypothetical protein
MVSVCELETVSTLKGISKGSKVLVTILTPCVIKVTVLLVECKLEMALEGNKELKEGLQGNVGAEEEEVKLALEGITSTVSGTSCTIKTNKETKLKMIIGTRWQKIV